MARLLSLLLLLILSPFFVLIGLIILIDSGHPIFFKQKRIGKNNVHFFIYKFRTMKNNIGDIPTHLLENSDSFYTYIGPFLRKMSLDEIPQLINIFLGDMKFIGPRPALHNQVDLIELRTQAGVHELMPGVTGWAQVNGRDELCIPKKVQMDKYYLKNKSLWLDLKILFLTFTKVLKMEGVNQ